MFLRNTCYGYCSRTGCRTGLDLWRYLQGRRKELEALKPKETEDVSTSYDDYLRDTYGG
jgi:hypothetical protein